MGLSSSYSAQFRTMVAELCLMTSTCGSGRKADIEAVLTGVNEFITYLDLVVSPLMVEHLCHATAYSANVPMRTMVSQLVSYAFEIIQHRARSVSEKAIQKYRDSLQVQDRSGGSGGVVNSREYSMSLTEWSNRRDGFHKICSERFCFPNLEKQLIVNLSAKLRKVTNC
jgi:hypothetical protein